MDFDEREDEKDGPQKIDNQHFDEAVELESEGGSEIESAEEDQAEQARQQAQLLPAEGVKIEKPRKLPDTIQQQQQQQGDEEFSEGEGEEAKPVNIPGAYNPNDYANLNVQQEVKELFKYITRYKPITIEIESKLRPFVPEYIPAVGEVDAFLKMDRPDKKDEVLGLSILDEPSLNQSKKAKLDMIYRNLDKVHIINKNQTIHAIENADKNPKEILNWIKDVTEIHKQKQPPSVQYTRPMPEIDNLMKIWPPEIEDALSQIQLPTHELDVETSEFATLVCALMDIPIHPQNPDRNLIESLHVLFTLYSEYKANQHFQKNEENYQPNNSFDQH